jgi:uncharacterized protein
MLSLPAKAHPSTTGDRFMIAVALLLPTAVTWLYFVALDGAPARLQQGAYGIGKAVQFGLPVVWVFWIQRRRERLEVPRSWSLIAGAVFGLAVAGLMAVLYFHVLEPAGLFAEPAKAVTAKVKSFGAGSPAAFLVLAVFYSAIHSLLEEYYWRWFVFGELNRQVEWQSAVAISSVGFAAHHVLVLAHYFGWQHWLTWLFTLGVITGGAFWAWLYRAGNSLAAPWLSHAIVDAAIFAIGYGMLTT